MLGNYIGLSVQEVLASSTLNKSVEKYNGSIALLGCTVLLQFFGTRLIHHDIHKCIIPTSKYIYLMYFYWLMKTGILCKFSDENGRTSI